MRIKSLSSQELALNIAHVSVSITGGFFSQIDVDVVMGKILVVAGLAASLILSFWSSSIAAPERVKFPKADLSGYTVYTVVNRADKKWIRYFYANDLAIKGARESDKLPNGAKLIMVTYMAELNDKDQPIVDANGNFIPGKLVAYGLMEKQAGWGDQYPENIRNGNWDYSVILPDKSHKPGVKVEKCLACHIEQVGAENDYTFTFDALVETARALNIGGAAVKAAAPEIKVAAADTPKGDAIKGKKLFKRCSVCHLADSSGKHKIGPNLLGIIGGKIAAASGYKYSKALKAHAGKTWDTANMDKWLKKPRDFAKGTKMSFSGFKKAQDRANVIAYLSGLK